MPHITVEYTEELKNKIDFKNLNKKIHDCLSQQETIKLGSIKTRSIEVNNVIVGDGSNNNFIHINLFLLPGRSENLKKLMAEKLFETAKTIIAETPCLLSTNVSDLGVYVK